MLLHFLLCFTGPLITSLVVTATAGTSYMGFPQHHPQAVQRNQPQLSVNSTGGVDLRIFATSIIYI